MTHKPAIYLALALMTAFGGMSAPAQAESVVIGRNAQTQITGKVKRVARDYFILQSGNKRFEVRVDDGLPGNTPIDAVVETGAYVTVGGEFAGERFGRAQFDAYNITAETPDSFDESSVADIAPAAGGEAAAPVVVAPQKNRRVISSPKGSFKMIVDE